MIPVPYSMLRLEDIKGITPFTKEETLEYARRLRAIFTSPPPPTRGIEGLSPVTVPVNPIVPDHPRSKEEDHFKAWVINQWRWSPFNTAGCRSFLGSVSPEREPLADHLRLVSLLSKPAFP